MRYLANFAVAVSVKKTDDLSALETELIKLVFEEPDKTIDDEDAIEFCWGYDSRTEAAAVVETLSPLFSKPEIVLVRIASCNDGEEASIIFKDT